MKDFRKSPSENDKIVEARYQYYLDKKKAKVKKIQ